MGLHRIPLLVCTSSPVIGGRSHKQVNRRSDITPLLYRASRHLTPKRKERGGQGREYQPILVGGLTYIGPRSDLYRSQDESI